MFSLMLLMCIPHMSWLQIFFGVNIHMLATCKYLLTCIYEYFLPKKKTLKKIQNVKYSISLRKDNVWNKLKWGIIFR